MFYTNSQLICTPSGTEMNGLDRLLRCEKVYNMLHNMLHIIKVIKPVC